MVQLFQRAAIIPLAFSLLAFAGCVSAQKYQFDENYNGSKETVSLSGQSIDTGETYELFFVLDRQVPCFDVTIHVKVPLDDFTDKKRSVRAYFIVERLIRRTTGERDAVFTELGRNYSDQWNALRNVTICSSGDSPLQKILPGDIFRVRFAPFVRETFTLILNVQSDAKIMVAKTIEDADVLSRSVLENNSAQKKGR